MPALERTYQDLSRPIRSLGFVVDVLEADMRIDALLRARYPWRSRAHFQRMLAAGDVELEGRPARPSTRVKAGMRVEVMLPEDPSAPERESADDLVFLYEDEHLAALDKPSGLVVHPSGRVRHGTLINKLHARYRDREGAADVVPRLSHRLDRDTSGVVLIAKNRHVDARMTEAFTRREVEKTYLALVRGVPSPGEGVVDQPLGRDPEGGSHLHMRVDARGQAARTRWRVERASCRHALVALEPFTGRTHQLRVHMAWLGHPILCDHLYGDLRPLMDAGRVILERLALHAHRLAFTHPVTHERLTITSPLPPDLQRAVAALGAGV